MFILNSNFLHWFVMFEDYSAAVGFIIIALTMLLAIFWLYGNFCTYSKFVRVCA